MNEKFEKINIDNVGKLEEEEESIYYILDKMKQFKQKILYTKKVKLDTNVFIDEYYIKIFCPVCKKVIYGYLNLKDEIFEVGHKDCKTYIEMS